MIYLGIDPGPRESCGVMYDGERVVEVVNLDTRRMVDWVCSQRGVMLNLGVACEWVQSYGMAVGKEVFETVYQIGILGAAINDMRLIPRKDIKLHLCGSLRAKDPNVRQALIDAVGPVGTKKRPGPCYGVSVHAWAALAVAVTASEVQATENEATFHLGANHAS